MILCVCLLMCGVCVFGVIVGGLVGCVCVLGLDIWGDGMLMVV